MIRTAPRAKIQNNSAPLFGVPAVADVEIIDLPLFPLVIALDGYRVDAEPLADGVAQLAAEHLGSLHSLGHALTESRRPRQRYRQGRSNPAASYPLATRASV